MVIKNIEKSFKFIYWIVLFLISIITLLTIIAKLNLITYRQESMHNLGILNTQKIVKNSHVLSIYELQPQLHYVNAITFMNTGVFVSPKSGRLCITSNQKILGAYSDDLSDTSCLMFRNESKIEIPDFELNNSEEKSLILITTHLNSKPEFSYNYISSVIHTKYFKSLKYIVLPVLFTILIYTVILHLISLNKSKISSNERKIKKHEQFFKYMQEKESTDLAYSGCPFKPNFKDFTKSSSFKNKKINLRKYFNYDS